MPTLDARICTDLSEIPGERWDRLNHPSIYLRYDWLAARSRTILGPPRFVVVSDGAGEPTLAAPAYRTDGSSHPGYDPVRALAMDDLEAEDLEAEPGGAEAMTRLRDGLAANAETLRPALTVGSPGRMGGVSYRHGATSSERLAAAAAAAAALERWAEVEGAGTVAWLYFLEGEDDALDRVLLERGYTRVVMAADCYLPILWNDFEGYLDLFASRRRNTVRNEMAALEQAGGRVEIAGAEALDEDLARLEIQWRRKYGRRAVLEETLEDYASLRDRMGEAVRVCLAHRHGEALGFTIFLEEGDIWWARFGGFDYSAGPLFLYFNLAFYHPVRAAIERNLSRISYSMSSYDTKRSRGCALWSFLAYVRLPPGCEDLAASLEVVDRVQRRRFAKIETRHAKGNG